MAAESGDGARPSPHELACGNGGRLRRPDVGVEGDIPLSFYTDAKAENGRAWVGGLLETSSAKPGPASP